MLYPNFLAILVAALVTLPIGFIWYHKSVFGNAWMKGIGKTEAELRPKNMVVQLLLSILCALFIAMSLNNMVIHQFPFQSMMMATPEAFTDPNSEAGKMFTAVMTKYANEFRSFKHGALHGFITGLLFIIPIYAVSYMYERRSFKLIMINAGYWVVSLTIMGGIICAWQ
jgi:Protein of unknown function (DUF1761)